MFSHPELAPDTIPPNMPSLFTRLPFDLLTRLCEFLTLGQLIHIRYLNSSFHYLVNYHLRHYLKFFLSSICPGNGQLYDFMVEHPDTVVTGSAFFHFSLPFVHFTTLQHIDFYTSISWANNLQNLLIRYGGYRHMSTDDIEGYEQFPPWTPNSAIVLPGMYNLMFDFEDDPFNSPRPGRSIFHIRCHKLIRYRHVDCQQFEAETVYIHYSMDNISPMQAVLTQRDTSGFVALSSFFIFIAYPRFFFRDQPIALVNEIQRIPKTLKHPIRERSAFNLDLSVCGEYTLGICLQNAYCPHTVRSTYDNHCFRLVFDFDYNRGSSGDMNSVLPLTSCFPLIYWRIAGNVRFNCSLISGTEPFVIGDYMWRDVLDK